MRWAGSTPRALQAVPGARSGCNRRGWEPNRRGCAAGAGSDARLAQFCSRSGGSVSGESAHVTAQPDADHSTGMCH
eukprot:COSAG01_NODE_4641_length_4858_cov_6.174827_6_plen_76_part_00